MFSRVNEAFGQMCVELFNSSSKRINFPVLCFINFHVKRLKLEVIKYGIELIFFHHPQCDLKGF